MKKILFLLFVVGVGIVVACTSDCTSCHPTLDIVTDERHQPLATCVTCHPPEQFANDAMQTSCGTDCFSCHPVQKVVALPQHAVINECIACHQSMDKAPFAPQQKNTIFPNNTLQSILQ